MPSTVVFLLKTLGLGILIGFVLGYLFKKVSKIVILLLAIAVILVVVFGHNDILKIDWLSIKDQSFDVFNNYFKGYNEKLMVLLRNIPFAIGFVIGGVVGLKKG